MIEKLFNYPAVLSRHLKAPSLVSVKVNRCGKHMLQKSDFQEKFVSEDTFAQIQGFVTQTDALS